MPEQDKKKSLLDKAIDALTDRDEKAAAAEAAQKAAEAEQKVIEAEKKVAEAKAKAEQAEKEQKRKEMLAEAQKNWAEENERQKAAAAAAAAAAAEAAKPKIIKEHTMTADETLSHLSLKYYGSAVRDYWMVIYEANKDVIGDNPAHVRPGLVVKIPELPENLKKKK